MQPEDARDMMFMVASIGALIMALSVGLYFVISLIFPVLLRLGTAHQRMIFLLEHGIVRRMAWHLAFAWTFSGIPVGIGLFYLVRDRDAKKAYLAAPFWFTGIFAHFIAYTLMFNVIRGVGMGYFSAQTFAIMDRIGFGLELGGAMLLSVATIIFGTVFIRGEGQIRTTGRLLLLVASACLAGGLIIALSTFLSLPRLIFNGGMVLFGAFGMLFAAIAAALLSRVFRQAERG